MSAASAAAASAARRRAASPQFGTATRMPRPVIGTAVARLAEPG
jgi:hypothetical protein